MKFVRKLSAEPTTLATYRHSWPDEEAKPPQEAGKVWSEFRDDPGYRDMLQALAVAQQGLCVYCEQRLVDAGGAFVSNDYQIEHVLPKAGGPARALDWTNLALACSGGTYAHHRDDTRKHHGAANNSCGQTKGEEALPAGCDPRTFPLVDPVVEVGTSGRLTVNVAHCQRHGINACKVAETVDLLNLNCERLRKARQDVGDNIRGWIVPILTELLAAHLRQGQQQVQTDLIVAGRLQPDSLGFLRRFWTSERCALGAISESWIANNQGHFL